ncbi:MAG: hypothetical protein ACYDD4_05885 [Acidimicrobiales bacterium]
MTSRIGRGDLAVAGVVVGLAVTAGLGMLHLVRSSGVMVTGDEPSYLVAALAVGRFHSFAVGAAYKSAVAHHLFISWPTPPGGWQVVPSHGHLYAYHPLGLPILLALPVALAGLSGANVALVVMTALLVGWIGVLAGRLSAVRVPWRVVGVVVFFLPAALLAQTQVFPDLLSGLIAAVVVLLLATIEQTRRSTWAQLIAMGLLVGFLPWLHFQNAIVGVLVGLATAVVHVRHRLRIWPFLAGSLIAAAGFILLAIYNIYVFAQWQGPGNVRLTWGELTRTQALALLVDHQQGLLVQLPIVLLGVAALWVGRRRFPVTGVTTVLVVLSVVVLSAASGNPFGGASFVGRYQWAAFPVLLSFASLYIVEMWRRKRIAAAVVTVGIVAAGLLQFHYIFVREHAFYSTSWTVPPPPSGPAWWGRIDSVLPNFSQLLPAWHQPRASWAAAMVLVSAAFVTVLAVRVLDDRPRQRPVLASLIVPVLLFVGTAVTWVGTLSTPAQTMIPMVDSGAAMPSQVGTVVGTTRVVNGRHKGYIVFGPYWTVPDGRYRAVVRYDLSDPDPTAAVVQVAISPIPPSTAKGRTLAQVYLPDAQNGTATAWFTVGFNGLIEIRVFWSGTGSATIRSVAIDQGP